MPQVVIIAGPNGTGKSTAAPTLLQDALSVNQFVNADAIAAGLSVFQPEQAALSAGRIMLKQIHTLGSQGTSFAFETTLASRSFYPKLIQLQQQGYQFHLIFLWLRTVDIAICRVEERVRMGGHAISKETIIRRYQTGLKNFFNLYRPISNGWRLYDNSTGNTKLIALGENKKTTIIDVPTWDLIQENIQHV